MQHHLLVVLLILLYILTFVHLAMTEEEFFLSWNQVADTLGARVAWTTSISSWLTGMIGLWSHTFGSSTDNNAMAAAFGPLTEQHTPEWNISLSPISLSWAMWKGFFQSISPVLRIGRPKSKSTGRRHNGRCEVKDSVMSFSLRAASKQYLYWQSL